MASIKELPRWEDEVYQIARGDKVEGGVGGIANMQAKTLAERTRYLKNVVESIPDYREFTFYKTENDPEGKLAGIAETHDGQLFRVARGSIAKTLLSIIGMMMVMLFRLHGSLAQS